MKIDFIDLAIILTYLLITVLIGLYLRNRARESQSEYMMGGKKLPWYMLGLSNASDMFDISGTMWMVTICFVYGFKSMWIVWLWPVFNQIFQMMYLSKWLRRSNASTGAEWLQIRFGTGKGSTLSHQITVLFAVIGCLSFMAYGFVGLGKFVEQFIPWSWASQYVPFDLPQDSAAYFYGIVFTLFAMFYSLIGGMTSIVIGDVLMYSVMTIASVCIGIIAYNHLSTENLNVPDGWLTPFFHWNLNLDWSNILPDVNAKITSDGFMPWGAFFIMMTFKGVLASLAGPAPNYDMQKVLSTRTPEEASKMSGFVSVILLPVRYTMIIGFTVLGLLYYNQMQLDTGSGMDFEKILPATIAQFTPPIVKGIILTGLMAAFMGTFSGTLNAAQSYLVNDIFLKYLKPKATLKQIMNANYLTGITIVTISIIIGIYGKNINDLLQWIVGGLYGGYVAANVLKWHWWRFNLNGFAWGMIVGTASALMLPVVFPGVLALWMFPLLFLLSLGGSIAGTFMAPAPEMQVLKAFYKSVQPWGWWKPVHEAVVAEDPTWSSEANMKLDMSNVVLGVIAQCCLTLLPMYLVLSRHWELLIVTILIIIIGFILKRTWWDKLHQVKVVIE